MKKRISMMANFFAFNLLFFALYLNFIHTDSNAVAAVNGNTTLTPNKGTVLVNDPEKYLKKYEANKVAAHDVSDKNSEAPISDVSMN
ncbi:MAG: hypothetical protein WKF70_00010 [Chitinophagaceae bacterium]